MNICPVLPSGKEWNDESISPWLRVVILMTSLMFIECGSNRIRVRKILTQDEPYKSGLAADIIVTDLPGVREVDTPLFSTPKWICDRLNILFPFGDGSLETAVYDGKKIFLRVPLTGYRKDSNALADFDVVGINGKNYSPSRINI